MNEEAKDREAHDGKSAEANQQLLLKGVDAWNSWRDQDRRAEAIKYLAPSVLDDMTYVRAWALDMRLCYPILSDASLPGANLQGVDMMGAQLWQTDLSGADLRLARFDDAKLTKTNLRDADLRGANFFGAELAGADLNGARLDDAVFSGTTLLEVDLSAARGLENVKHERPSPIDVESVYRAGRSIPLEFLRGLGVPEAFIIQARSPALDDKRYYSCFISYSTRDQEFASRLFDDLQKAGIRCWFAPKDVKGGKKLHDQITSAIRRYDKLLLVLSKSSISSSWVRTEIAEARAREVAEKKTVLFPISLIEFSELRKWRAFDADLGSDSAREIREYYIPDFSDQQVQAYGKALGQVISSLKMDEESEPYAEAGG